MISNPARLRFEHLDLPAMPAQRGRSPDLFRFNGGRHAGQTDGMPAEAEETPLWRCRSKFHQDVAPTQEIGL